MESLHFVGCSWFIGLIGLGFIITIGNEDHAYPLSPSVIYLIVDKLLSLSLSLSLSPWPCATPHADTKLGADTRSIRKPEQRPMHLCQ